MASNPDVFLQGLIGTTGLRPIQDVQQGQQQLQLGQQQIQSNRLALNAAQQQAAQRVQFQHDTQQYFANPSPANLAALVKKYPQQAEQLQKTYDVLDAPAKQSRVQQLGALYNAAKNNRPELVAKTMQSVIDAEKAQGIDTSDAEDALAAVNAGDPKALNYVTAFAQAHLAAADADFAKSLGVGADQKNFASTGDSAIYDQRTGEVVRQAPPKPIYRTVDVFDADGNKVGTQVIEIQPGGGGQGSTTSGDAATAPGTGPRSVRNNNPGNLKGVNDSGKPIGWVTSLPGYQGVDDKGYAIFADPSNGQGAQQALLGRYMAGGRRSVSLIVEKWAPRKSKGGDNTDAQVDNYIASVAKQLNVNPNDALTPVMIPRLAAAMARFESGGKGGTTRSGVPNTAQPAQTGSRTVYSSVGNTHRGPAPTGYRWKSNGDLEPIAGGPADTDLLPSEVLRSMGEQYLAGDKSVLQNLGRGAQGARNIVALRGEIMRQAQARGMTGRDIAAQLADYSGIVAGERAAGTRSANIEMAVSEAQKVLPLARQASNALPRNGFVPFAKAQQMVQGGTNDVRLRRFVAANNALVNVYARAISPSGVPTVADKEHAREMLSTAFDQPSYNAVLDQMEKEMQAAREAPHDVRGALRGAVGGAAAPGSSHDNPILVHSPQEAAGKHGMWVRLPDGRVGRVK